MSFHPESRTVILLIIIPLLLQGGVTVRFTKIRWVKGNQTFAEDTCKQLTSTLPKVGEASDEVEILKYMQSVGSNGAWLSFKRQEFDTYKWLDGTDLEKSEANLGYQLGHSCGVIDLPLGTYDFLPCETENLSFLCQKEGCSSCISLGRTDQNCVSLSNTCYIYVCGTTNWFSAKSICQKMGASLAVIKEKKDVNTVTEIWKHGSVLDSCSNSWIGFRKEDWTINVKYRVPWDKDEPKPGESCVILSRNGNDLCMKSSSCFEEHDIICDKSGKQGFTNAAADDTVKAKRHSLDDSNSKPALINGFSIGILFCTAVFWVIIWVRKFKNSAQRGNYAIHEIEILMGHDV